MSDLIALFGGTFDPVHFGHLRVCLEAGESLAAQEVRMLPSALPPHRETPGASSAQRLEMLELALKGQQRLTVDARELRRNGPSYTIDSLLELRAEVGQRVPLVLLIGADQLARLDTWKDWQKLLDHAHIAVLTRPGSKPPPHHVDAFLRAHRARKSELRDSPAGLITAIDVTALSISASEIRRLVATGKNPRYLLPEPVFEYLQRHGLYQAKPLAHLVSSMLSH